MKKKSFCRPVSWMVAIIIVLSSFFAISGISVSAATSSVSSGAKGISVKIDQTTLYQGEKLSITPVVDVQAKRNIKTITASINGKTYILTANKKTHISLPTTLKSYNLNVKFTFKIRVPVSQPPKKKVNQTYATVSQTINVVKDLNKVVAAAKKQYPQGSRQYITKYGAVQCHGFGVLMSDLAFGAGKASPSNKSYKYIYATKSNGRVSSIRPGDLVRYRFTSGSDHTIFVLKTDATWIYYAHANGDGNNTVRYSDKVKRSELEKYMKKKLLDDSISTYGYIAHYKYNYL